MNRQSRRPTNSPSADANGRPFSPPPPCNASAYVLARRRSPLLMLAAALVALAAFFAPGAQPASAQAAVTVSLSASPNPVDEGADVTVTATLSSAVGDDQDTVIIPLIITDGTAEPGDHGTLAAIYIPAGESSRTGTITTARDADTDHETFTVSLGTLPSGLSAGSQSSVQVTIRDSGLGRGEVSSVRVCWDESERGNFADCYPANRAADGWRIRVDSAATHVKVTPTVQQAGTRVMVGARSVTSGSQSRPIKLNAARAYTNIKLVFDDSAGVRRQYTLSVQRAEPSAPTQAAPSGPPRLVWSATLTPYAYDSGREGCSNSSVYTVARCTNALTEDTIELPDGTSIVVDGIRANRDGGSWRFWFSSVSALPAQIVNYALEIKEFTFRFDHPSFTGVSGFTRQWPLDDAVGDLFETFPDPHSAGTGTPVAINLVVAHPLVSISASPSTVDEGDRVTVTASLSKALSSRVTIPLTITDGTAEPSDYSAPSSITISAGETSGAAAIATRQDADTHDETFTVSLGELPSAVAAGSPSSVEITIIDDDLPFGVTTTGSSTGLQILPTDDSVTPVPPSQRTPEGASASEGFCYTTVGKGDTEYIRYPDGRLVETTKQSPYIRSVFACN